MILFGQQISHWTLLQILTYINPADGICLALACQAAIWGHAKRAALSLPDGPADHMCGWVRWRTVLWLSFLWSSPRSKFLKILWAWQMLQVKLVWTGLITKINKSLLREQAEIPGTAKEKNGLGDGSGWNTLGGWTLTWMYSDCTLGHSIKK